MILRRAPRADAGHVRTRGMTLIEVLAALVLVGIVLPVVMHGLTLSMRTAAWARHQTEASRLADSKLSELLATSDASALDGGGDFGPDRAAYRWESESVASDHGLYEVTVTIFWSEADRERTLSMTTLVYPESEGLSP